MQTMFGLNLIWVALVDASLRTNTLAYSASNAFFGNLKALALRLGIAHREIGSVDGAYTKIEILYLCVANDENDTDAACVAGINIHKIGLFAKDNVFPRLLLVVGYRLGYSCQTYHLFILRQRMNLHMSVAEQLTTKVFATSRIEIDGIGFIVDGRDAAHLWVSVFIDCGKREYAYVAEFLDASCCVHNLNSSCFV